MTECKFYNPDFIILSSLASFYVPCVILLVVNYKIIKAFLKRSNKGSSKNRNRKKKKKKRKVRIESNFWGINMESLYIDDLCMIRGLLY